eukprot:5357787-Pyramimonas_sp.AAC.1
MREIHATSDRLRILALRLALGVALDEGLGPRPVAALDDCPRLGLVEEGAHGASFSLGPGSAAQVGIGGPPTLRATGAAHIPSRRRSRRRRRRRRRGCGRGQSRRRRHCSRRRSLRGRRRARSSRRRSRSRRRSP